MPHLHILLLPTVFFTKEYNGAYHAQVETQENKK